MEPNEHGLVICKKKLIDEQRVPNWPDGDKQFEDKEGFTTKYTWEIEGRKLCVVHWGTGIGSNDWKNAEVVILCDEFHLPRRTAIANVQGLREHKVSEGDLASMKTLNSSAPAVDIFALGHRLRWLKQMALRGRARCYDERGVCGKQRLVVACNLGVFMANVGKLFPGATVHIAAHGDSGKWAERVVAILNGATVPTITTSELGKQLHRDWRASESRCAHASVLQRPGGHGVASRPRQGAQRGPL
jgi:hypothetical protein